MLTFKGKVALVVGGGSGIGAEIASGLAAHGAEVVIADIKNATVKLDVTQLEDWERVIADVTDRFGGLDLLSNSAGGGSVQLIEDMTVEQFDSMVRLNLYGAFYGIKASFPALRRRGGGAIVNFASTLAVSASPTMVAYGAAKAGVIQAGRVAAIEGAPYGIRVNTVLPGVTRTPMTADMLLLPEFNRVIVDPVPMRRAGEAVEVAAAALFLLSDAASYITGTEVIADGGKHSSYGAGMGQSNSN